MVLCARRQCRGFVGILLSILLPGLVRAAVGGSISGTVKDQTGAVIAGAAVTATNSDTGVRNATATDNRGAYTFAFLPVGHYVVEMAQAGFKPYRCTGIGLDIDSAIRVDAVLDP